MTPSATLPGAWLSARRRVLTRNADRAEADAAYARERAASFPDHAAGYRADADVLDAYAVACRAAADNPDLPNPELAFPHRQET